MNGSSIVAGNDEDDDNAAGNAVDEEGSLLTSNKTCATRGHSRSRDDIDGRGSGLELSHGHGRAGGLKSQDDVEPFEDEYHEVNSLHGSGEEEEVDIPSLSPLERLKLSASFWPYMVPLFTVYAAEYALQAGTWTAIGFPVDSQEARDQFYEYSNWTYQAGVFLSRSSGTVYQASMAVFWLMPILQCINLVFFSVVAATHFWYNYTLLILCFYVGKTLSCGPVILFVHSHRSPFVWPTKYLNHIFLFYSLIFLLCCKRSAWRGSLCFWLLSSKL